MAYGTLNIDNLTSSDGGVISPNINSLRNRIINGAMVINQRALGTVTASGQYTLDRWVNATSGSGAFSIQQSSTAPAGFINSMLMTVTTADSSLAASDNYVFRQKIEGFNCADLAWGTASASTVTLSFWVRSSVTGTYGGAVTNSVTDRAYPFTYTISLANTFEYKTITIAGDTSGTWPTDNSSSIQVRWSLGTGTDASFTANAWGANNAWSATGAGNFMATNGATFYITGVQLEKGSTATSFDYRPYGTEFDLCRRYYELFDFGSGTSMMGAAQQTNQLECLFFFYPKRTGPTVSVNNGTYFRVNDWRGGDEACNGTVNISTQVNAIYNSTRIQFQKATSNLTVGYAGYMNKQGGAAANPMLYVSAEL